MMLLDDYRAILRCDFVSFNERAFFELNPQASYKPAPHIEAIATSLEECRMGRTRRLAINLPPRHLKSHTASIAFVAWYLGHNPAAQIICASYGQDLADKLARDCRTVMCSKWYQELFRTRLVGRGAVSDFITAEQGGRMSTSVGGVLTGRGADLIIIDDPLKPDDALSETQRTAVNEWYQNTLLSRLNDKEKGCIIIIMQRLHQDDLIGHVTEREQWEILSFPAIAEEFTVYKIESPLGSGLFERQPGDILHPVRESQETLAKIRKNIGEYNFNSQYQQSPTPPGGSMVKLDWLQYYEPHEKPARFLRIVQSWDTANKAGELNDYSVCTTWGVDGKRRYLLHVFRKKLNYPDLKRAVIQLAKEYNVQNVLIEDKASGIQLIQEIERALYSTVTAYKPPPGSDKIMRLHAQTDLFENGLIFLPKEASWLQDYVRELTGFPGTRHDDQIDSTAQALDHMRIPSNLEIWALLGSQL